MLLTEVLCTPLSVAERQNKVGMPTGPKSSRRSLGTLTAGAGVIVPGIPRGRDGLGRQCKCVQKDSIWHMAPSHMKAKMLGSISVIGCSGSSLVFSP